MRKYKVLFEALILSTLVHLIFFSIFSIKEVEERRVPRHVYLSVAPIKELWKLEKMEIDATDNPNVMSPGLISFIEIKKKTSSPKLELYHKIVVWEDEPEFVAASGFRMDQSLWKFEKEDSDLSAVFANLMNFPLSSLSRVEQDFAELEKELQLGHWREKKFAISSSLAEREIVSKRFPVYPESVEDGERNIAVKMRIGVDSAGNVRNLFLVESTENFALDEAVVNAVKGWKFDPADSDEEEGLRWGWVIVPFVDEVEEKEIEKGAESAEKVSEK